MQGSLVFHQLVELFPPYQYEVNNVCGRSNCNDFSFDIKISQLVILEIQSDVLTISRKKKFCGCLQWLTVVQYRHNITYGYGSLFKNKPKFIPSNNVSVKYLCNRSNTCTVLCYMLLYVKCKLKCIVDMICMAKVRLRLQLRLGITEVRKMKILLPI